MPIFRLSTLMRKPVIALLPALLLFAGCAEELFDDGQVSLSVDGTAQAPELQGEVVTLQGPEGPWRYVRVEDGEKSLHLGIPLHLTPGTHTLGIERNTANPWIWVKREGEQYHSAWGQGELVLTERTSTKLAGTFSATLQNHDQSQSVTITDGTFSFEGTFSLP